MAIELPSKPDVLDERLASLEDPLLAERLFRENPALFAHEPPRTQREVLAWTTRRFGTALIAVTAALSIAAGYVGYDLTRNHAAAPPTAGPPAAAVAAPTVAAPARHAAPPAHRVSVKHPATHAAAATALVQHHATAPVQHHATAPVQHHATAPVQNLATAPAQHHATAPAQHRASAPVAVHHTAAVVVPVPAPHRIVQPSHVAPPAHHAAPAPAHHAAPAPARSHAAAPRTAAEQLAAWEAAHPASHARAAGGTSTDPASRTHPRTEPAGATEAATSTTTTTATSTEPTGATSVPAGANVPDQTVPGGAKSPPSNPGGIWTERPPVGGILGGGHGPVIAPVDPCTPRGGRTGIVMQAISILASGRH